MTEGTPSSGGTIAAANAACRALKLAAAGSRCAVYARTLASARAIADFGAADVVLVRAGLGSLKGLRAASGRVVATAALPATAGFKRNSWRRAAVDARSFPTVDLSAGLRSRKAALTAYLGVLRPIAATGDRSVPGQPGGLVATDLTGSTTLLDWNVSSDNRGVSRYGVYLDGIRIREVSGSAASLPALACGGPHLIEIDAADLAGNRSAKAAITASLGTCSPGSPTPGLVAAYGFDETSGAHATDASGNGNEGSLIGAARTTSGQYGRALTFDGLNDQVAVLDDASLDLTDAMTLEAWVRPSPANAGWRTVVLKEQPGDLVYGLYAAATGFRPSGHVFVGGNDERVQAPAALPGNAWSHLATTYDGSALRLYVNGALVGTIAATGDMGTSSGPLRVGGNSIWDEWFEGAIDEVRVYDRALTAAQIQDDMSEPVGAPVARHHGADGTGQPPHDRRDDHERLARLGSRRPTTSASPATRVYRDGTLVASPSGTTSTVSGLACGTTYTFAVDAVDAAGNTLRPGDAHRGHRPTARRGPTSMRPSTPTGLAKTSSTQTAISVSWTASSDDFAVTGVRHVPRQRERRQPDRHVVHLHGLTCGTSYSLEVDAADAAGNRSAKATISASTNACPDTQAPTAPTGLTPGTVDADEHRGLLDRVHRQRRRDGYGTYRNAAPVGNPTGTSYTFTGLTCSTSYTLAVDAADAAGNRSAQTSITARRRPARSRTRRRRPRRATSAPPDSRRRASRSPGTRPRTTRRHRLRRLPKRQPRRARPRA